ncbi:MAG: nitrite reductase [Actinobacteria bacterium]|nr:nitrite reductase [Actinomycetota bacterium]
MQRLFNINQKQMNNTPALKKGGEATVLPMFLTLFIVIILVIGVLGYRAIGNQTTVASASAGAAPAAAAPAAETNNNAVIDAAAMPASDWKSRDPIQPAALTGKIHTVSFDMTEVQKEVAPGVMQEMWTFNGELPGPTLRGSLGDTFKVTIHNKGKMSHSIDFHASKVAWSDEMRSIAPGESLVYTYTADYAGVFMYHCGTAPALHHIGNGMYGAVIVDPPVLAPVDKEFFVSQSELYLGPDGKPGDLSKMMSEKWDAVVFNGYFNQYKFAPIHVEANKRYRIWVMNEGPNENSAFHIVGTIFDTVFKEGSYLLQPDARKGGSQVLDLQPAQGGFVEFTFAEDGLYPFVTHKFANVGKGALGFFAVGKADTTALGGH